MGSMSRGSIGIIGRLRFRAPQVRGLALEAVSGAEAVSTAASSVSLPRQAPSPHVRRIADELLALPPAELKRLRQLCRERLIPKPSNHKGPLPKGYDPRLKVKRDDQPFPVREHVGTLSNRITSIHPVYVFAGQGPGILPAQSSPLQAMIMAPHMAELMEGVGAIASTDAAPQASAPGLDHPAEAQDVEVEADSAATEEVKEAAEAPLKPMVNIRLLSFDSAKKITVIKEVRAMLGEGLKESKEKVEGAPCMLRKGVARADAETQADRLRAAGAEIALE